jgi:hypothetical protein
MAATTAVVPRSQRTLQALEALQHRTEGIVGLRMHDPNQRHLEIHPRVRCITHLHQSSAYAFDGANQRGQASATCELQGPLAILAVERSQLGGKRHEEALPKLVDKLYGYPLGVLAGVEGLGKPSEGRLNVALGKRIHDCCYLRRVVIQDAACGHLVECAQRVASRTPCTPYRHFEIAVGYVHPRIRAHPDEQVAQQSCRKEPELEMLSATADGGENLLGIRRRKDEHDVGWGFLESLQQRVGGGRRQHVDLVHDVDLPSPGSAKSRT